MRDSYVHLNSMAKIKFPGAKQIFKYFLHEIHCTHTNADSNYLSLPERIPNNAWLLRIKSSPLLCILSRQARSLSTLLNELLRKCGDSPS